MEYRKCEFCGEQVHIRSKKCPFCNNVLSDEPKPEAIVSDEEPKNKDAEFIEDQPKQIVEFNEKTDEEISQNDGEAKFDFSVGTSEPKDYIYKAEVRHSIEYTRPFSNWAKVFIAAFCTIPIIGQILGAFIGVFFCTYEEEDRSSFGKALIALSIGMFLFYLYNFKMFVDMINSGELNQIMNSIG